MSTQRTDIQTRSVRNPHLARHLRQRLERRFGDGTAMRDTLNRLTDAELIEKWHRNHQVGVDFLALTKALADIPSANRKMFWIGMLQDIFNISIVSDYDRSEDANHK